MCMATPATLGPCSATGWRQCVHNFCSIKPNERMVFPSSPVTQTSMHTSWHHSFCATLRRTASHCIPCVQHTTAPPSWRHAAVRSTIQEAVTAPHCALCITPPRQASHRLCRQPPTTHARPAAATPSRPRTTTLPLPLPLPSAIGATLPAAALAPSMQGRVRVGGPVRVRQLLPLLQAPGRTAPHHITWHHTMAGRLN